MKPGYYILTRGVVLSSDQRSSYRVRLPKGTWVVTDGVILGMFNGLDWYPVEWVRGVPVVLDAEIEVQLSPAATRVPVAKLQAEFKNLMFVEEGEPIPDMPQPALSQLNSYLVRNRHLIAYTYDKR